MKTLFGILGSGLLIAGLGFCPRETLFPALVLFGGISLGALFISIRVPQDFSHLFPIFVGAFMVRIFLSVLLYVGCLSLSADNTMGTTLQYGFFIGDGYAYSHNGAWIARQREEGREPTREGIQDISVSRTVGRFDYWNAAVYGFSGESPFSMFFLSALASSSAVIFVYLITELLWNRAAARWASVLAGFWPSHILWGSQNLKEPFTIFFVCLSFWSFLQLQSNFRFHLFGIWLVSMAGLFSLRFTLAILLFFSFLLGLLVASVKARYWMGACLLALFLVSQSMHIDLNQPAKKMVREVTFGFLSQEVGPLKVSETVEHFSYLRKVRSEGARTAFLADTNFESAWQLLLFAPLGLLYVFFSPFPWQIASLLDLFAACESLVFYGFFLSALKGYGALLRRRIKAISSLTAFVILVSLLLALIEGNVGTIFRHRSIIWVFIFVFIAIGVDVKKQAGLHAKG